MSERPGSARPVALVTGATGGIGRAVVDDLAADHEVLAVGRNAEAIADLDALPGVRAVPLDLTDDAALIAFAETLDRLDVLVHAAAVATQFSVADADAGEWRRQYDVNVVAPALLTRLTLPLLRASSGRVIFINSGAGTRAVPGSVVYSATKFALRAVADSLRAEEADAGVRVSTVAPGPTDTEMARSLGSASGRPYEPSRLIRPASVAAAVRLVVDAGDDTQITEVAVRPRRELS
ncbi:SDR family oxidoreductase [Planctomonas psychrotolerans]|uniref:SDR family oxidoreductase n=1 Tax=Planctomonas psychrotolerans TaxID=2528712 RepID=UPI001238B42B|nr:SDR family oxidoreductase [Planctomonas psychrotolerans]